MSSSRLGIYLSYLLLSILDGCLDVGFYVFAVEEAGGVAVANSLRGIFWLAMTLAELPTGYLGDVTGPKRSLLLGVLLRCAGFALYYQSREFPGLVAATVLTGVAVTFFSGMFPLQLMLVSKGDGAALDWGRITAEMMSIQALGRLLGALIFYGVATHVSLRAMWLACMGLGVVSLMQIALVWRPLVSRRPVGPISQLRRALRTLSARPALGVAMCLDGALLCLALSLATNWIVFFIPDLGANLEVVTGAVAAASLLRMAYSATRSRLVQRKGSLSWVWIALGAATIAAAMPDRWLAGGAVVLAMILFIEAQIRTRERILSLLPEGEAGTLSSIQSLVANFSGALGSLALGWALRHVSIQTSWLFSGVLLVGLGAGLWALRRRAAWL